MESGKAAFGAFVAKRKAKHPKPAVLSEKAENALTFCEFPAGLRNLIYTGNRIKPFDKEIKRALKKRIQFVTEGTLEKRPVSRLLHCNEGIGRWKVRCWREIAAYYESKYLKYEISYRNRLRRIPHALVLCISYSKSAASQP